MFHTLKYSRVAWLAIGLVAGLVIAGLIGGVPWPDRPLHAVATDRNDTFAMATGPLDQDVEAVFFLDFLTGDLRAAVPNRNGVFSIYYDYNVMKDLEVAPGRKPRFLMTTGGANLQRRGATGQLGNTIVYVAEVTTGNVAAYGVPWNPSARSSNRTIRLALQPLDATKFRAAAAVAGAGVPPGPAAGPTR